MGHSVRDIDIECPNDLSELGMIVKSVLGKFFFHGFIKFFVQNVKAEEKFEISDILS